MIENILIRGVNWIGDGVMTIPALRLLKQYYSSSLINILVKPLVAPLFENNPCINEIILYKDEFKRLSGKLAIARLLRQKKYSKSILFQNAFDAALITFLARIPERIGYNRDKRKWLLTKPIEFKGEDRKMHHIDYYLNLLQKAGINLGVPTMPWIYLNRQERLSAQDVLSVLKHPILGINAGSTYGSAKRWSPERFAEVAIEFKKDTRGGIVIFGGSQDKDISKEIEGIILNNNIAKEDVLNLSCKTNLRQLCSLISEINILVTNDSGPMHIAAATTTPTVSIFGSTSPTLTAPNWYISEVIKSDVPCSPCFQRTCKYKDIKCMDSIYAKAVSKKVKGLQLLRRAVFFDRDGVLCRDATYLNNWSNFDVFPQVENINKLRENGFLIIGVTNQSGIAKKIIEENFVKKVNKIFIEKYGFEDFYYCPHQEGEYCFCRKPEPGMVLQASEKYRIDFKKSYIVGDKDSDMQLANLVGAKGILVLTGKDKSSSNADFIADDLNEVLDIILSKGNVSINFQKWTI